jgi:stage II sporulation protein D
LLGSTVLPASRIRVKTERSADIGVNGRHLHGTLEIIRQQNHSLLVINYVSLEDYLRGVLSKEAPDYWPSEALRAIAIIARTYAVYQRLTKAELDYDVTADVMSQDYGGKSAEKAATSLAVDQTRGLILTYRGEVFPTFYHSTCGGRTEDARVMGEYHIPPLRGGVVCHFCSGSPFYAWKRRVMRADLGWALRKSPYGAVGAVQALRVVKRTPFSRVEQLEIIGSQRTVRLSGYDFRALLGFDRIRSPLFTVEDAGDAFVLDGHGWGHGVGLCQWGAAELARRGMLAPEILGLYYPGAGLARLEEFPSLSAVVPTKNPQ